MNISTYTTTFEDMIKNTNQVFETVVQGLQREGFLSEEDSEKILSKYAVVAHTPGMFSSLIKKLFNKEQDNKFFLKLVKIV